MSFIYICVFLLPLQKIHHKYSTDPEEFDTLQKIVSYEVNNRQNTNPNSATVALLWLKRLVLGIYKAFTYKSVYMCVCVCVYVLLYVYVKGMDIEQILHKCKCILFS